MMPEWKGILKTKNSQPNILKKNKQTNPNPNIGFTLQSLETKIFQKDFLKTMEEKKRILNTLL